VSPASESVAIEIDRFLTTNLYHHRFNGEQMLRQSEIPAAIVDVFDRMGEAQTGDEIKLRPTAKPNDWNLATLKAQGRHQLQRRAHAEGPMVAAGLMIPFLQRVGDDCSMLL
jgi:hypothetical protein